MSSSGTSARRWLIAAVFTHLFVSAVHGAAHNGAHVPLSRGANLFVLIVILAGPLVGLALMWAAKRLGAWLIAMTMAGSLVFGFVNHFMLAGPDHVTHVDRDWRSLFTATAVGLALTEALAFGLAIRVAGERKRVTP